MEIIFHLVFVLSVFVSQGTSSHSNVDSKVYKLVYQDFPSTDFDYCFRVLNKTDQIGCQSKQSGNVGVLHQIKDQAALDEFISEKFIPGKDKSLDYAVFLEEKLFNKFSLLMLLNSGRVSGILVYAYVEGQEKIFDWSPEKKCPIHRPELYNDDYGKRYHSCSEGSKLLNPIGEGILDVSIPIPIFYISKPRVKEEMFQCMNKHNGDNEYPYCAVEMKSFMNGAGNSEICTRRQRKLRELTFFIGSSHLCSRMGGHNVIGSLKNLKNKKRHNTILVTSPIDSRSFMSYSSSASNADIATGFITTLAVASILGKALTPPERENLDKNIVFAFVDGDAFDGIGAKKMAKELKTGNFPIYGGKRKDKAMIKMKDINNIVELRELGLMPLYLYAHYDPVSYAKKKTQIDSMLDKLKANSPVTTAVHEQTADMGIPPSTIQTILKSGGDDIPSVLLTEYDDEYINRHHRSRQDNLRYLLSVHFSSKATEKEMLEKIQPLAEKLGEVAETVAKSVYEMAVTKSDPQILGRLQSDTQQIGSLIYCFLHNSNCSYFDNFLSFRLALPENEPLLRFVSVQSPTHVHNNPAIIGGLLHGFLGEKVGKKAKKCDDHEEAGLTGRHLYYKNNPQTLKKKSRICLWASVFYETTTMLDDADDEDASMWTESVWDEDDSIKLRMFLMQSDGAQGMVLMFGIIQFLLSIIIIFTINKNAKVLFPDSDVI